MYNSNFSLFWAVWNNFLFDVDYAVAPAPTERAIPHRTGLETWIWRVRKVTDAHYNVKPQLILYYNYVFL